jgi:hypothetical protein
MIPIKRKQPQPSLFSQFLIKPTLRLRVIRMIVVMIVVHAWRWRMVVIIVMVVVTTGQAEHRYARQNKGSETLSNGHPERSCFKVDFVL